VNFIIITLFLFFIGLFLVVRRDSANPAMRFAPFILIALLGLDFSVNGIEIQTGETITTTGDIAVSEWNFTATKNIFTEGLGLALMSIGFLMSVASVMEYRELVKRE